jgi:hypothetical protein
LKVRRSGISAVLVLAVLLLLAGCSDDNGGTISGGGALLVDIPWTVPEITTYTLFNDEEEIGSAVLSIEAGGEGENNFKQSFEFPGRQISDKVVVAAAADSLAPATVTRVVVSPDGRRTWDVTYGVGSVTVVQEDEDDERTDTIDIPKTSYDTWTDLFLWRTIEFQEDYEVKYAAVVTADFAKPDVISIVLKVTGLETVTVPAGTYQAWRLEIRSGGRTQKAWIANDDQRTLVRYDNTELVFELEE